MNISKDSTVAEIVTQNIKAADVFKKYDIDFCCGGGVSIEKACTDKEVDYTILAKEIEAIDSAVTKAYNYDSWKLDFLIDHIENVHHTYVTDSIPVLLEYAAKVVRVHGYAHKEVVEINNLFIAVAEELTHHMMKEERILFPFIKELIKAEREGTTAPNPHFGTVNNPINMMEHEHENAGNIFKKIALLSNNYKYPEAACNTFKALYAKLQEFEQDLHQHIHLENNILFPKAISMEQLLSS